MAPWCGREFVVGRLGRALVGWQTSVLVLGMLVCAARNHGHGGTSACQHARLKLCMMEVAGEKDSAS
jgi:hypothetical protein